MSLIEASEQTDTWQGIGLVSLLMVLAVAVHGYHPYAEDGGVYVAGIKKLLDPALYPAWTEFVTEHLRFSVFANVVAGLVRATHLRLETILLALYCASVWATLYAGWMIARRITPYASARAGAVTLLACWLTLPVAGTSLMLMDPYMTARSFSTPLLLMALAWGIDTTSNTGFVRSKSVVLCILALATAALFHPLMAAYGLAAVLVSLVAGSKSERLRQWGMLALLAAALLAAGLIQANAPAESDAYVQVAITRYYWFPFVWRWYELLGLVAPLCVLWALGRQSLPYRILSRTGVSLGLMALAVALLFAQEHYATHLVARLQPLRAFQMVYLLMIVLLGAWLGERVLKISALRWAALVTALGGIMLLAERSTYPNSAHLEWPFSEPVNPWEQAFVWARDHSPLDARFALDAHYITEGRRENAQCFRAIAERSAPADYSKDGGEASITPALADEWLEGEIAQTNLEREDDAERLARLRPLAIGWVVLETGSRTAWHCPYTNDTVKVCKVP